MKRIHGLFVSVALSFTAVALFVQTGVATATDFPDLTAQRSAAAMRTFANAQARLGNPLPSTVLFISQNLTERAIDQLETGTFRPILFRDDDANRAMDTLMRREGKFPVLIGDAGVGKSAVASLFIENILLGRYPETYEYKASFKNSIVLRVSARRFLPGGTELATYLDTVHFIQSELKRNIIVLIDECHFLHDHQVSVLREEMSKDHPVPVWLETDSKSFGNSLKSHPTFLSLAQPILVRELGREKVETLVTEETPNIAERYDVHFSADMVATLVDISSDYRRDIAEPRRSLTLLEDFAIAQHRAHEGRQYVATKQDLFTFVAQQTGLPVLPQDETGFAIYMNGVRERMKSRIIAQDHMVDGVVDQFIAALTSRSRQHSIALMLGPTGVGKSLLGEVLAEEFYGDKNRYMELDMTQFSDTHATTSLFGASNGFISSDKEKGALCDFFDGRGRGGGILVMNEIEEMSSEVFTRFMEIFDKGEFRGGDGKVRHLGRTLIILTSNKNSDKIMSYDAIKGMMKEEMQRRMSLITQDQLKKAFTEKATYTESDSKVVKSAVLERVDRLYFAAPLLTEDAVQITTIELNKFVRNYEKQSETKLKLDTSLGEVITRAFYNESLGARQIRTAVQQSLTKVIQAFKDKYGYTVSEIQISATTHPSKQTVSYLTATDPSTGNTLTIDGPTVPVANKMLDGAFRDRLMNLEANLSSEIFGQQEAIKAVVSAVKSRFMRGGKEDIVAGFLAGMTGSGKSQLAKSLAKFLFERSDAYQLFEMGRINDMHDLGNIFSPAKGIIGSDEPGELEAFLTKHPDGGVLLFDEMSNAGAGNKPVKEAVAKQFYTMFQEGIFRTPSGKVFDLSNYIIILTGNDGEEIFKGLSSDSLLEHAYEEATKKPGMVEDLLRKAGFTDAFIGRLAFTVLMRPTLGEVKVMIARKLINEWRLQVQKNQPFDITYDDQFVRQVGELMFSPVTGARSINRFVNRVLGQAVGDEALKFDWDHLLESGKRGQIKLQLSITKPELPFYTGDKPDEKKALLQVEALQDGAVISTGEVEFTKSASFMPQVHVSVAENTAYHEMGHAVASFTSTTGKKLVKITIIPENLPDGLSALGYAQYKQVPTKVEPGHDFLVKHLAGLLAGSEAEILKGQKRTVGRSNDVMKVGNIAKKIILENHLIPELDSAHAYASADGDLIVNLPEDKRKIFDRYVDQAIEEGRALAIKTLRQNWHIVQAGSEILIAKGTISEREFEELVIEGNKAKEDANWFRKLLIKWGYSTQPASKIKLDTEAVLARAKDCESSLEAK